MTTLTRTTETAGSAAPAKVRRAMPRRRTELGLLAIDWVVITFAYILASLGTKAALPTNLGPFVGAMVALSLVVHLANRWLAPDADAVILPIVALLNGLGYVVIARLATSEAPAHLQAVWTALGVAVYVATLVLFRRSRDLERYRYLLALVGIGLLLSPLLPVVGETINGSRLWLRLGPISFQPVELAKLCLVIFFASYFVEKRELLTTPTARVGNHLVLDPRPFGPILLAWGFSVLIIVAEKDVAFALLIFLLFLAMLWMATGRLTYVLIGAVLFVAGTFLGAHLLGQVNERIAIWIDPWKTAQTTGYQIAQAQYAMGSGGLAGSGLGLGHPNLVPLAGTDMIFAAIGEELGLLGTTAVVIAFALLVGAGLRIALAARSQFAKLLAAGLTTVVALQSFIIMAGIIRILPFTGITLPFVAYGGSSLVANYVLVALLMRLSTEGESRGLVAARPSAEAG